MGKSAVIRCCSTLALLFIVLLPGSVFAQCVVFNEIMINAAGSNDGSNDPNTSEWIELYNTCANDVDLSCYVITDGDFAVTLPLGTTIPANGFMTIGSANSGVAIDLNWGTCNCTAGNTVGILTNGTEQLMLSDPSGIISDAVIWGGGQLPVNLASQASGNCASVDFFFNDATEFNSIPGNNTDGCAIARTCDGGTTWQEVCGASITAGTSNSGITVLFDISASQQNICTGSCINFNDLTTPQPASWSWQFEGATTATSLVENPTNICYDAAGTYDVTLTITNACGTFDQTFTDFVEVLDTPSPTVVANGPLAFCEGQSVELSTNAVGTYQWQWNGTDITDAIQNVFEAFEPGDYSVIVTNGTCTVESDLVTVISGLTPDAVITPAVDQFLCDESLILSAITDGDIQWYQNGNPMAGETGDQLLVTTNGSYWFETSYGGTCENISNPVEVELGIEATINITASDDSVCAGDIITLTISGDYDSFTWENGTDSLNRYITSNGIYTVIAEKAGCQADSSVTLFFSPLPTIDAGLDLSSTCEGYMELMAIGEGEVSWWLDETLLIDSTIVVVQAPTQTTSYIAQASLNGCLAEDQVMITSDCVSIFIPNSLTPNDDGINDVFKVEARGVTVYEFIIFNRWGDEVFHSIDPDDVWTGGKDDYYVPDGVYVYQITALNEKNESLIDKKHMRGTITVFR